MILAVALSLAHLLATARAAPAMRRVGKSMEREDLARVFARFERWQAARATLQSLTFAANVWALVALLAR